MLKKLKPLIILLILASGLTIMWFYYGKKFMPQAIKKPKPAPTAVKKEEKEVPMPFAKEAAVPVRAYKVERKDFSDSLPAMGSIKSEKEVELKFEVNGVVSSINFKEADLVNKGDVVATLVDKDAYLKLQHSKAKLESARSQTLSLEKKLQVHEDLYRIGAIIKPKLEEVRHEYNSVKSQADSIQKETELAQSEIEKTSLRSPIDGIMGSKDVEVGEFVTSNTKVATIFSLDKLFAEVGIIEKDISKVALGQKAKLRIDTYPDTEFEGEIENISPLIEAKTRMLNCKIAIKNPDVLLLPGMFVRANISIFSAVNTLMAPIAALEDENGDGIFDTAFVVSDENFAIKRNITTGYMSADLAEIKTGLEEGELVVVESQAKLKDQDKIEVIEIEEPGL